MRTIKFRGVVKGNFVDDFNGTVVYGSLVIRKYDLFEHWAIVSYVDGLNVEQPVDENSVAQLVGYDKDGKEVYEGDIVTNFVGEEFTAEIFDGVITSERAVDYVGGVEVLKLKEAKT